MSTNFGNLPPKLSQQQDIRVPGTNATYNFEASSLTTSAGLDKLSMTPDVNNGAAKCKDSVTFALRDFWLGEALADRRDHPFCGLGIWHPIDEHLRYHSVTSTSLIRYLLIGGQQENYYAVPRSIRVKDSSRRIYYILGFSNFWNDDEWLPSTQQ